jgi:hypothetical protein
MHFEAFFEEWHKLLFKKDYKYVFGNLKKVKPLRWEKQA